MHRHKKILPLLLVVFAVTVLSTLAALPAQERATSPRRQSAEEEQQPVADYAAAESDDPEKRARRRERGKRYEKQSWVMQPPPQSGGGDVKRLDSWMREVPAFPAGTSDVVVIGETTDAQVYLSGDKSGVYTEFTVRVDEILKDDPAAPLAVGG
ncbi:MAG: hypothetical protein QOD32_3433, partial [Pyrinomonadaceae bacterium]|nr:hypothetical protein [Pyrinomonadaceae bacterium]